MTRLRFSTSTAPEGMRSRMSVNLAVGHTAGVSVQHQQAGRVPRFHRSLCNQLRWQMVGKIVGTHGGSVTARSRLTADQGGYGASRVLDYAEILTAHIARAIH